MFENESKFMVENNITPETNLDEVMKLLGIEKIDKNGNEDYKGQWKIIMKGAKGSFYENGIFNITIDFPDNFPQKNPEVRILNKIYHLNVSPKNGHVFAPFLNH